MSETGPDIGLYGLGTMGAALALNIAESGFAIAVCNRTDSVTEEFHAGAGDLQPMIVPALSLESFVAAMKPPRNIILMVPAGAPVDETIEKLRPLLDADDLIIDGGNANFADTDRRSEAAHRAGELFLGIGISGGAEGARHGPSIMGGGDRAAWDRVADIMRAIAADHEGTPCATWMGEGGAGHFVKMVHNGIEYADMQMIAEIYGIMRDGFDMPAQEIGDVFARWNEGPLQSYLVEISASVCRAVDPETGRPMPDIILDSAGQKGTGRWTAIEALKLGTPVTAIDAAVAARNLSSRRDERARGQAIFGAAPQGLDRGELTIDTLEQALLVGKIACYAQGFEMFEQAADDYGWRLPLPEIAKVWRAGCIIRSTMLDGMAEALSANPGENLMNAPDFSEKLQKGHVCLRETVAIAVRSGHPVPALGAAIAYFDTMRTARGTANLIQAQRDYFGAHGFERTDGPGRDFHGPWGSEYETSSKNFTN